MSTRSKKKTKINKKKEDIYFIRWGNLNPVKHNEGRLDSENEKRTYHTAPCYKGIYAFPQGYIEPFLLGGSYNNPRCKFLLDDNGNKIKDEDFYDFNSKSFELVIRPEYRKLIKKRGIKARDLHAYYDEKEEICYVQYSCINVKKFKYTGDIWHHLKDYVKNRNDIIREVGSWVKTSYKVYIDALRRCDISTRFESYMSFNKEKTNITGNPHTMSLKFFVKDHYEVFIEHIK